EGGEVVGNRVRVRVKKNKVARPFQTAEFDIMFNEGISRVGDLLDMGVEYGIIEKRGSFYSYGEERLGQGRENVKAFLRENPALCEEIERRVREAAGLPIPGMQRPASAETASADEGEPGEGEDLLE
ncbi:MAG: DNA recombination/repair protein RecA, partial [Anaerolineae bacterium]|nr:DNA recombination/repair protein RecA [Anaerolineae bacterium]